MTTRSMMIFQFIMCWLLVQPSLQAPSSEKVDSNEQLEKLCRNNLLTDTSIVCTQDKKEMHFITFKEISSEIWNEIESVNKSSFKMFVLTGTITGQTSVPLNVLQSFKNLETFKISRGNSSIIHEEAFYNLPSIKQILLEQIGITELKLSAFKNMGQLEEIHLESNNITEINAQVFIDLPALQKLHLNNNKIKTISQRAFEYLNNLVELDLSENEITQLNSETFYGLQNLINLDLTNNNLTNLENRPFMVLTNLKNLSLASNEIKTIVFTTFHGLKNLETLNLSNNKLILPSSDLFENTIKVNYLDLSGNGLNIIQFDSVKSIFQNFNKSGFVNLERNNITCDCELSWILQLKNESQNSLLRTSLANLSCLLEETVVVTSNTTETTTSINQTNDAGIMVDGKRGHMKKLSELYLEGLPCPTRPEIMDSSQSSIGQEKNAHTSEPSSSAKVHTALGIFILTLTTFLL